MAATVSETKADSDFSLSEVAPGAYVHQGLHQDYTKANRGDIANAGFVIGKRCVAVIDTGGSPSVGKDLRASLRTKTDLPVCYVINTHMHPDHVLGNSAFAAEQAKFVGHAAMLQAVPANRQYFIAEFLDKIGEPLAPEQLTIPEVTVDGTVHLDLGDRRLTLQAYPKAHTGTDITVLDEQTGTFWLGDLLFVDRIPAVDGSVKGWLQVLTGLKQNVLAMRAVPGHGPVVTHWKQAIEKEQGYLTALVNQIRQRIKQGGTLEAALASVGREERKHWRLFDAYHKRNITKAFAELEWE